jgi:endonuclease-8
MPEGDTLFRTAAVLRRALLDEQVRAARARPGGAQLVRVVGSRVDAVRSLGKHLLIGFDAGLTLHTHLGMHGSWHRYAVDERWRRHPDEAVAVLSTPRVVAVCFEAPVVELLETRAVPIHPALGRLGPDLLDPDVDIALAAARLRRSPVRHGTVAEALLDQSAVAGIGNVYRSEVLFCASLDPFRPVRDMTTTELESLLGIAVDLLRTNVGGGARVTIPAVSSAPTSRRTSTRDRYWVYGRAGRPCRRCGALIRVRRVGELPRSVYWCPGCQGVGVLPRTASS